MRDEVATHSYFTDVEIYILIYLYNIYVSYKNVLPISVNRHTYKFVTFFSGISYVWCPCLSCQRLLWNLREIRNVVQKNLSEHREQSLLFRKFITHNVCLYV